MEHPVLLANFNYRRHNKQMTAALKTCMYKYETAKDYQRIQVLAQQPECTLACQSSNPLSRTSLVFLPQHWPHPCQAQGCKCKRGALVAPLPVSQLQRMETESFSSPGTHHKLPQCQDQAQIQLEPSANKPVLNSYLVSHSHPILFPLNLLLFLALLCLSVSLQMLTVKCTRIVYFTQIYDTHKSSIQGQKEICSITYTKILFSQSYIS